MTENCRNGRRVWLHGSVAAAAGLAAVVALSGAAGAAPAHPASPFAAQARTLGMNSAQAQALQHRADSYVTEQGGTQVSVDRVRLSDGSTIILALPSGKYTDGKEKNGTAVAAYTCGYGHFCAYSGTNFTGDVKDMFQCAEYSIPWSGRGSWKNNQTTGTVANFESSDHVSRWHDGGAYSQDNDADWSWVWYVRNC